MPLNVRIALWLVQIFCPRLGAQPQPKPQAPDFIPDCDLETIDRAFRRCESFEDDYECMAAWAEYCARQESTRHHLFRCLNK